MEFHSIRGGTREDLEAKRYRIGVGVSLGNKWFTVENIVELLKWTLSHTRDTVVVYVADYIHAINIEVRQRMPYDKALKLADQMGTDILSKVEKVVDATFSPEDIERVSYAKWATLLDDSYRAKVDYLIDLYSKDVSFKEYVTSITRNYVSKELRSFSEEEVERLTMYILEELPEHINRVPINGVVYDAFTYPHDGEIVKLAEEIQQGVRFPEIKQNIMDTEPKVFIEVR